MKGREMVTPEQTTKAKEKALALGVQVWVLEPGKRYVALSCTNDGIAYEVVVQSRETSPALAQGPPIGGYVGTSGPS